MLRSSVFIVTKSDSVLSSLQPNQTVFCLHCNQIRQSKIYDLEDKVHILCIRSFGQASKLRVCFLFVISSTQSFLIVSYHFP